MDQSTLEELFIEQAEWREQKAIEFPNDDRNATAAEAFRRLASSAKDVPDEVILAAAELYDDLPDIEQWNEMCRTVGFGRYPDSAESFLREFISSRTG
ncbi:hypothetical protein [Ancylobacter oerskovii]|uniref:Uncharacterized protein n=1 Tax=Ancylobacter oerskovii TaxID=459519 RepID=A0ABW4Z393_9HYPH|nr:hypothetical protein [Ancylobacter oerskovii]MBS7546286.1 hypothetical protein [Ancylobacter oerskovii]